MLVAEDDEADRLMLEAAASTAGLRSELRFVPDGESALDYLFREGAYASTDAAPRPYLVLLDVNLPRMNGRAVVAEMRECIETRYLPVVLMSTAQHREEVRASLAAGANAVIVKPGDLGALSRALRAIESMWLEVAERV